MEKLRKPFGQLNLTWVGLLIWAVIAGVYTGVMAMLPATRDTSFADISITFEWWVLFGILIIMNSKSPLDSGLKCLVFFLVSQPLVYLVQVPANPLGWGIFRYYPDWFVWTLFTFPMGFVGYFMKKEKWWSLLILAPMLVFVGYHYYQFFHQAVSFFPHHLLSALFCAVTMLLYPLGIFSVKKLRLTGLIISIVLLLAATVLGAKADREMYRTTVLMSGTVTGGEFDDTWSAALEDPDFGTLTIEYNENVESYMVNAAFTKLGTTRLLLTSPAGETRVYDLTVGRSTYTIKRAGEGG